MPFEQYAAVIEACAQCAAACDHCAASCLLEGEVASMARCIGLDHDCADACRLAAGALARESEFLMPICAMCASLCEACAEECSKHVLTHCVECAAACQRCAKACRSVSEFQ